MPAWIRAGPTSTRGRAARYCRWRARGWHRPSPGRVGAAWQPEVPENPRSVASCGGHSRRTLRDAAARPRPIGLVEPPGCGHTASHLERPDHACGTHIKARVAILGTVVLRM